MTSIIFPKSLKSIGKNNFTGCSSLEKMTYRSNSNDWEKITGNKEIGNCSKIKGIKCKDKFLNKPVFHIDGDTITGTYPFYWIYTISLARIPKFVKKISKKAFSDLCDISRIAYEGTIDEWKKIEGNNVIWDYFPEISCSDGVLKRSIFLIKDDTVLGVYDKSILSIDFPNEIKKIGENAFNGSQIENVEISENILEICSGAFSNCPNLKKFSFSGTKSKWEKIKKAKDWKNFNSIEFVHCSDGIVEEKWTSENLLSYEKLTEHISQINGEHVKDYILGPGVHYIEKSYFDINGNPLLNENGIHKCITKQTESFEETSFYGLDGKLTQSPSFNDNFAIIRSRKDDFGNLILEEYFDKDGKRMNNSKGIARYEFEFLDNRRDQKCRSEFFDKDNKPVCNEKGYAKYTAV